MVTYSKKVLVVDDDPDIREIISLILDMEGFTVCGLDNGREVLDRIQSCRPDLILLDVMLGDSDGRDICKILKNAPDTRQIPVIIVSATHGLHTAYEKRCGADDYISKPFDVNELIDRVRKYAA